MQEQSRLKKLDSVRGIAAMMVLVGHSYGEYFSSFLKDSNLWALQIFWDGLDAVSMFFILSGYVLTLQISNQKTKSYAGFALRRFFRIGLHPVPKTPS